MTPLKATACVNGSEKIVHVNSDSCARGKSRLAMGAKSVKTFLAAPMVRENALL